MEQSIFSLYMTLKVEWKSLSLTKADLCKTLLFILIHFLRQQQRRLFQWFKHESGQCMCEPKEAVISSRSPTDPEHSSGGLCVWFTAVQQKEDGWCSARQDRFSPGRGNLNCTSDCGLSFTVSQEFRTKQPAPADASWQRFQQCTKLFLTNTHSCSIWFHSSLQVCDFSRLNYEWEGFFKVT